MDFICTKCGACCQNLQAFHHIYDALDRGDGVCKNFDVTTLLCNIYETRPQLCRVKESYSLFAKEMTWDEYIAQTHRACAYLRSL